MITIPLKITTLKFNVNLGEAIKEFETSKLLLESSIRKKKGALFTKY